MNQPVTWLVRWAKIEELGGMVPRSYELPFLLILHSSLLNISHRKLLFSRLSWDPHRSWAPPTPAAHCGSFFLTCCRDCLQRVAMMYWSNHTECGHFLIHLTKHQELSLACSRCPVLSCFLLIMSIGQYGKRWYMVSSFSSTNEVLISQKPSRKS